MLTSGMVFCQDVVTFFKLKPKKLFVLELLDTSINPLNVARYNLQAECF